MTARYDWSRPRYAQQFTGFASSQNPTGLVVRMVNHSPIPTTAADQAEMKAKRIVGTILSFPKLGFVSAPYAKKAKAGKEPPAPPKRLLEPHTTDMGEVTSVRVYGFHKVSSNFDKGPRDDDFVSTLRVGQTLTFYLNEFMYDTSEKKTVFAEGCPGVIPPYSVVELQLNPSHNQSKGYGLKIAKITPQAPTLYSYLLRPASRLLCGTAEAAQHFAKDCAKECESVVNQVEQARFAFVSTVDRSARVVDIREDLEFLRLECPQGTCATPVPGVASLDVSFEVLQRFTNFPGDLNGARTLVDLAIAAGALRVLVTYDDYYNHKEPALGQYRCVPIVDAEAFLASVEEAKMETTSASVTFPVPWTLQQDPSLSCVAFRVFTVPVSQDEGEAPHDDAFDIKECVQAPCPDLPIQSPVCACEKGYRVLVGNPGQGEDDDYYVLDCFFNAAPKTVMGGASGFAGAQPGRTTGYKRVRVGED